MMSLRAQCPQISFLLFMCVGGRPAVPWLQMAAVPPGYCPGHVGTGLSAGEDVLLHSRRQTCPRGPTDQNVPKTTTCHKTIEGHRHSHPDTSSLWIKPWF